MTHKNAITEARDALKSAHIPKGQSHDYRQFAEWWNNTALQTLTKLDALIAALDPDQLKYLCSLEQPNAEEMMDIFEILNTVREAIGCGDD